MDVLLLFVRAVFGANGPIYIRNARQSLNLSEE